jgi:hypothetical protein
LQNLFSGNDNVGIGSQALEGLGGGVSVSSNISIGSKSLYNNSGSGNIAIG